MLLSMSLIEI